MEQGDTDVGEIVLERRFKVGELVAFVEGSNVRGYRTDSGEVAWVKEDYGGGFYGIKMAAHTTEQEWSKILLIYGWSIYNPTMSPRFTFLFHSVSQPNFLSPQDPSNTTPLIG